MELGALLLARLQFAFTIAFHILFPSFTTGLASWLVMLEGLWLVSGRAVWRELYLFWAKIFAVSFAMGVVSGIVMNYQFGTNWSRFAAAGNVIGPLLSYEGLTAFSWRRPSSASCCSAGSACRRASTSSPPAWWRSARCSPPSG